MSFWSNFRADVCERTTTSNVSLDLFDSIKAVGISAVAVVQPTFYMGRFYILSFDYVSFVEKLLACSNDASEVFRYLLYIRETANTMGRCVRNAAEPIEGMMTFLDPIYEESLVEEGEDDHACCDCGDEDCCGCGGDAPEDEFARECAELASKLKAKFDSVGISPRVSGELANRLADAYSACVSYVQALRNLHSVNAAEDIAGFMVYLIDIQYLLDTRLRYLLLEDVFSEERPFFSTGIAPWMSHAIEELAIMACQRENAAKG